MNILLTLLPTAIVMGYYVLSGSRDTRAEHWDL